jgi:hypothetical protein
LAILEIVQLDERSGIHQGVEEIAGGVIGSDAGRNKKAGASAGSDELSGQFGEKHVGVDVAARRQRVFAAAANVAQGAVGSLLGRCVAREQFGIAVSQFGDQLAAAGGADGVGDVRSGEGEKLAFL